MKRILIASGLMALSACGSPEPPADAGLNRIDAEIARREANRMRQEAENRIEMAPPSLPPAAPPTATLPSSDRDRLIGRWADRPGCQGQTTEFLDDGTFRLGNNISGRWRIDGSRVTITANGRTQNLALVMVTETQFQMLSDDGERLGSYRCTSPAR